MDWTLDRSRVSTMVIVWSKGRSTVMRLFRVMAHLRRRLPSSQNVLYEVAEIEAALAS
jgi:hypothetical protein